MKISRAWMLAAAAVAVVAAAVVILNPLAAQTQSTVGYVDSELLIQAYAGREIEAAREAVRQERDRLQEEFDRLSADLDEAAKEQLFNEYQGRLEAYEQELGTEIEERLNEIGEVLEAVARENGVTVVVDRAAVVWGGVDLTGEVLRRLGVLD